LAVCLKIKDNAGKRGNPKDTVLLIRGNEVMDRAMTCIDKLLQRRAVRPSPNSCGAHDGHCPHRRRLQM